MSDHPISRRQAIRTRLMAATRGPWNLETTATVYMSGHARYLIRQYGAVGTALELFSFMHDAEFVANSWTDIEFLLDSTDALISERNEMAETFEEQQQIIANLRQQLGLDKTSRPRRIRRDTTP